MPIPSMNGDQFKLRSGEPLRANNGYLYIPNLWYLDEAPVTAEKDFICALESFPFPEDANNVIQVPFMNAVTKFAGQQIFEDMEVVMRVLLDDKATQSIEAWRAVVSNAVDGRIGYASESSSGARSDQDDEGRAGYKMVGHAIQVAPNGETKRIFTMTGMFPSRYQPGSIDMTNDDINKATVTFSIDRAYKADLNDPTKFSDVYTSPFTDSSISIPLGL